MFYLDTSVIVKLYVKEAYSREASDWIKANNEAVPRTVFHELEFTNAIKLKQFRNEMSGREAGIVLERFNKHEKERIFYNPPINWSDAFTRSLALSKNHTKTIGSCSLDVIHVALALSMGADRFFTFDHKQSQLASAVGLQTVNCTISSNIRNG
ncbi:MAG: type II toxin-antitoxin system VapC family toxin [Deltaproteobacteria bacterium]|nr:type II toxin-antitoxin system VapC family toxin [Deltaproteobacteria bacterium]